MTPVDGPITADVGPVLAVPDLALRASRRAFIKGVIVSGAYVSASAYALASMGGCARQSGHAAVAERLLTLEVNGTRRRVDVMPNETLATTLRNKLGLTGTKLGCDRGECGACTVLLDGTAVYACSVLTHRVRARRVLTIEGVDDGRGGLHAVQRAFVEELAPQCGFCTPGQVMSAIAFLATNPQPKRKEARVAMSGNLCRCGAYEHYLNGVMRAAAES
jgi:aerobic-type carbon monoxide dehydrogenase small subunit (CoxS/CutS family)